MIQSLATVAHSSILPRLNLPGTRRTLIPSPSMEFLCLLEVSPQSLFHSSEFALGHSQHIHRRIHSFAWRPGIHPILRTEPVWKCSSSLFRPSLPASGRQSSRLITTASIELRALWFPFPTTRLCSTVHLTQFDLAFPLTLRASQRAFLRKEPPQSRRRQKQLITSSLPIIRGVNLSNTSPLSSKILVTPDPVGRAQ